jgi:hypothetical protein
MRKVMTASALSLARFCLYPHAEGTPQPPELPPKARTRSGSATHRNNERYLIGQPYRITDALAEFNVTPAEVTRVYRMHEQFIRWHESELCPPLRPEVAYEYDPATTQARELDIQDRGYPNRVGCVYGTADAVEARPDGALWIVDVKTGFPGYVEKCERNAQLLFLAMAAALVHGATEVRSTILFLDEHSYEVDEAQYDALQLAGFEALIQRAARNAPTAKPTPGPHCDAKFCKHRAPRDPAKAPVALRQFNQWCPAYQAGNSEERIAS